MAGYRRFIAYVYEYPQGKKGNGKGFIKVESRDGICRMQYKLTGIYGRESVPGKVYGYVRENGECQGILLGECDMAGTTVQFEHEMAEDNMGNRGYKLSDLCGLVLMADSDEMYGSGWDDQPVDLAEIKFPNEVLREPAAEETPENTEKRPEEGIELEEGRESEKRRESEERKEVDERKKEPERISEEPRTIVPESEMVNHVLDNISKMETDMGMDTGTGALNEGNLFSDNSIYNCSKIRPADGGILGMRDRGLMGNKFLRHGYSNYGHLIIGRREEDGRYILGVPGVYDCQESLMAGMFGFPYFKETGGKHREGRFGYWYRLIDEPDWDSGIHS